MLSPSAKSDLPPFTIRDYELTIGRKIPTSRFGGENENSSGSSRLDQPNGFWRSTLPSTTPSTSNAIFYPDVFSRRFEPRRSLSGIKVGLPPDPDHNQIPAAAAVNVSMPNVQQHRQADHLGRAVEIAERIFHPAKLRTTPDGIKASCFDNAIGLIGNHEIVVNKETIELRPTFSDQYSESANKPSLKSPWGQEPAKSGPALYVCSPPRSDLNRSEGPQPSLRGSKPCGVSRSKNMLLKRLAKRALIGKMLDKE